MKGLTKNQITTATGWLAHARLKNEFTEDKKYHNLMTWLRYKVFTDHTAYNLSEIQADEIHRVM